MTLISPCCTLISENKLISYFNEQAIYIILESKLDAKQEFPERRDVQWS